MVLYARNTHCTKSFFIVAANELERASSCAGVVQSVDVQDCAATAGAGVSAGGLQLKSRP